MRLRLAALAILGLAAVACEDDREPSNPLPTGQPDSGVVTAPDGGVNEADAAGFPDAEPRRGIPVLGYETHDINEVDIVEIGSGGLNLPRDLAFNPQNQGELWVVNRRDDSTVTYFDLFTDNPTAEKRIDPYALHFMEETAAIAFGAPGTFATCGESRNTYNDMARGNDFMGPALWSSDMSIYAMSNPEAVDFVRFDLGSHLDMLHESPLCMGIAWDRDNVYWTFDGLTGSISRYDFVADHGPGYDDHSDGIIKRYVTGEVLRVADVPSHMVLDHETGLLYIADTGNARIAVLDTNSGTEGRALRVKEPGTTLTEMDGATMTTLVDGPGGELTLPSGLALVGEHIYVADNANGRITAFAKATGERIDWLDTGMPNGALMGIEVDHQGSIWFVDSTNRLMKISARP